MEISFEGLSEALRKILEITKLLADKGHNIEIYAFEAGEKNIVKLSRYCIRKSYPKFTKSNGYIYHTEGDNRDYKLSTKFLKSSIDYPDVIYGLILTQKRADIVIELWFPENIDFKYQDEISSDRDEIGDEKEDEEKNIDSEDEEEKEDGDDDDYEDDEDEDEDDEEEKIDNADKASSATEEFSEAI